MTRATPWFSVFSVVSLLAAGCAAEAGGRGKVTCAELCEAKDACIPTGPGSGAGHEGYSLEGCLAACAGWPADCREATLASCLACWESCDEGCAATACGCEVDKKAPGEPCDRNDECEDGSICFDGTYCVGSGPLRVTLSFEVAADFDLHLQTPAGNEIYFASRAADGGVLDVDQCGPAAPACIVGDHVENIVFRGRADSGVYRVWAVNYDGRDTGAFRIEAATPAGTRTFSGTLPREARAESEHFRITVD